VIHRAHHLPDEQLLDCYLNERDGMAVDPRIAEHLTDCGPCGVRYAEMTRFMDTLRSEAELEADAIFTPERLRAQRQQIGRLIDHVNRPGRVITFPGQLRRGLSVSSAKIAPRWTAAAAAAGLFVGVALGASYRWDTRAPGAAIRDAVAGTQRVAPIVSRAVVAPVAADDAFLSELETALDRPRTRELLAIDDLTPHFREIRTSQ
jgi:anti-sigma factor RsiW